MKHGLLLVCIGWVCWSTAAENDLTPLRFEDRANLALRQTGDRLLTLSGDDLQTIPLVENDGKGGFVLRLECGLRYDTLPSLLAQALLDFQIDRDYTLVIRECGSNTNPALLGYNRQAYQQKEVACLERTHTVECADIYVYFLGLSPTPTQTSRNYWWWWLVFPVVGLGFWWWKVPPLAPAASSTEGPQRRLGKYAYDPDNQQLSIDETRHALTFRENKLLCYLADHPNQVLKRSDILAAVWEDEGVLVGRSLDVFISRLRKQLKEDERVQIKSVHGVGYRFEIPA